MDNSTVTPEGSPTPDVPPIPEAIPSDVAPPPEQNAIPPKQQPAAVSQENYFKSKVGILKIVSIIFAAIAFALTLSGFVKGKYYDFKCPDDLKRLYDNPVFLSQDYKTCEDHQRGTFQNCQVYERQANQKPIQVYSDGSDSRRTCPNPAMVKAPLILIGLVFGVIMILFVVPVASADIRKNPKFLKLDMVLQFVGFGIYLISAILIMSFVMWVFNEHYHTCPPCENVYTGSVYKLVYIISGGVFTLITAILFCVVGCMLMSKTRRLRGGLTPGYSMGGGMMSTGTSSMGMMGSSGYGSPMANNMGMNSQPIYWPSQGASQPRP